MTKPIFLLWSLLGFGVSLVVFLSLGPRRRASIPAVLLWVVAIAGASLSIFGLSHSTSPSFAPRVSLVGSATAFTDIGKPGTRFAFDFQPDKGALVHLQTQIIVPHWADSTAFRGRKWKVTYLRDETRTVSNEVIAMAILSGQDAGWHDSLDARPLGVWLAIPMGAAICGFGYIGIRFRKDDLVTASLPPETPQGAN